MRELRPTSSSASTRRNSTSASRPPARGGLRTVQYVSPQVWAWRRGRAGRMAPLLDLVLCLLPFERAVYDEAGFARSSSAIRSQTSCRSCPDAAGARRALGIRRRAVVAILPGSRAGEVARLADDFAGAAAWLAARGRPRVRGGARGQNVTRRAFEAALAASRARTQGSGRAGRSQAR
jgi:lipid-A-disaccharide synthase